MLKRKLQNETRNKLPYPYFSINAYDSISKLLNHLIFVNITINRTMSKYFTYPLIVLKQKRQMVTSVANMSKEKRR